jgi:hypothetical protein
VEVASAERTAVREQGTCIYGPRAELVEKLFLEPQQGIASLENGSRLLAVLGVVEESLHQPADGLYALLVVGVRLRRKPRDSLALDVDAHILFAAEAVPELLETEVVWNVELPATSSLQRQDGEVVDERADGKRGFSNPSLCGLDCEPLPERAGCHSFPLDRCVPFLQGSSQLREVRQECLAIRLVAGGWLVIVAAALESDRRSQQVA